MRKSGLAFALLISLTGCDDDGGGASGCGSDLDCRGERICVEGACQDPGGGVDDGGGGGGGAADLGLDAATPDPDGGAGGAGGAAGAGGEGGEGGEGGDGADAGLDAAPELDAEPDAELDARTGRDEDAAPLPDAGDDCADEDGDGYGEGPQCLDTDCDDDEAAVNPGADEIPYDGVDQDCDGADATDLDDDGFDAVEAGGEDCADDDPDRHPGIPEVPGDGVDQNCDGSDEGAGGGDFDGDGHLAIGAGGDDCDDNDPNVNPDAEEVPYDGEDQDCDGEDLVDFDGDGFAIVGVEGGDDCDDLDPDVNPDAPEIYYNGVDDDCDEATADGDADGDGFQGFLVDGPDCDDMNPEANPEQEEVPYNGFDDDCDGMTRDDDLDADGVPQAEDCDDMNPDRSPERPELPDDGVDQDCDDRVDEAAGAAGCDGRDDMVPLPGDGGCIDRYEASGPGAGGAAVSAPGVAPWTGVNFDEARDACVAAGKVLCPPEAWGAACNVFGVAYPYGPDYQAMSCNGVDAGRGAAAPTGAFPDCVSPAGAFDLSGNVAEWVDSVNDMFGDAQVNGGSYLSDAADLECGVARFRLTDETGGELGFRCCLLP